MSSWEGPQLFYRHCGGDLIAGSGWPLDTIDAQALHGLHLDEAHAAGANHDLDLATRARTLVEQLDEALKAAARWRRAMGDAA